MNDIKLYEVGGHIRDGLLGIESNDVDYSVDMTEVFKSQGINNPSPMLAYVTMNNMLESQGYKIFVRTPDCFTTRAMFPQDHEHEGVADFVMCRKELGYIEGTRKPRIVLGTLHDDLLRRDFKVNAIARCVTTDDIIDPFDGESDLEKMILSCPVDAVTSFNDDPLRILRAFRFCITKGFHWDDDIQSAIENFDARKMKVVSVERIMNEIGKCFKHDTHQTLDMLNLLQGLNDHLYNAIICADFWLIPTNKNK